MVKFQRRQILAITAGLTFRSFQLDQLYLSASTAYLLCNVRLVPIVCIRVLAGPGAIFPLPATEYCAAVYTDSHLASVSNPASTDHVKMTAIRAIIAVAQLPVDLLECRSLCGPVAQLVRAGDSSQMVRSCRKTRNERDEFRETLAVRLMAILSQAGGTPPEGAETT